MSLAKTKWYYISRYSVRWSIYIGVYGWHLCNPLFAIGQSSLTSAGLINYSKRKFIWGFLPVRKIKEGDYIYVYHN